jgi:hypothetical protein
MSRAAASIEALDIVAKATVDQLKALTKGMDACDSASTEFPNDPPRNFPASALTPTAEVTVGPRDLGRRAPEALTVPVRQGAGGGTNLLHVSVDMQFVPRRGDP